MNNPQHHSNKWKPQIWLGIFAVVTLLFLFTLSNTCAAQTYTAADTNAVQKMLDDAAGKDGDELNLELAEKALALSQKTGYLLGQVRAMTIKGRALCEMGNPNEAITLYTEALHIAEENHFARQQTVIHYVLGSAYSDIGDFKKSIPHYDLALKGASSPPDTAFMITLYNSMGVMMLNMHDYPKALESLTKAANFVMAQHHPEGLINLYNNIAGVYIVQQKYADAFKYLKRVIVLDDSLGSGHPRGVIYMNLAICFDEMGHKDSCLYYYFKALDCLKEKKDAQNEARLLNGIGTVYYEMEKWGDAEKYYKMSLAMAKESSNLAVIAQNNYDLSTVYFATGDYKRAFLYRDSSAVNKDSLYTHEQIEALTELTTKYKTQEIQQQNKVLQDENDLQKMRMQRKNILVYSIIGGAALFVIISVLLIRQNRLKNAQQKMELEQKQLLAQINPHFIFNCLNSIQQFVVQNDTANANKYLADFALLMRQTLDNSKDGIISLQREMEYLENYLSFEHMRFEDKFTYTIAADDNIDTESLEIPSMIIQPFVENAVRHGLCNLQDRKGILKIIFYKKDSFLYCSIDDNGIGMEQAKKLKEQTFIKYQSLGMELTRQRLALVSKLHSEDYKITIINKEDASKVSQGTTIIIKFPLQV